MMGPTTGTSITARSDPTYAKLPLCTYSKGAAPLRSTGLVVEMSCDAKSCAKYSPSCFATWAVAGSARSPESIVCNSSLNSSRSKEASSETYLLYIPSSILLDLANAFATIPPNLDAPVFDVKNLACSARWGKSLEASVNKDLSSFMDSWPFLSSSAFSNNSSALSSAFCVQ
eukprot:jgi/Picre1/31993/NNA_007341.t1